MLAAEAVLAANLRAPPPPPNLLYAQAQSEIVRAYRELRSDDAVPGSQSCYRITVRQLEALVRLSEAMARVYCQPEIHADHVREVRAGPRAGAGGRAYWPGGRGTGYWRAARPGLT